MAPKAQDNYDAEIKRKEIPNDQVMEDAGKIHLGKSRRRHRLPVMLVQWNLSEIFRLHSLTHTLP
eukprot:scaffold43999_cov99-Amphora_coffeaeformis.AAC.1